MAETPLKFSAPLDTTHPIDLHFGADTVVPETGVTLRFAELLDTRHPVNLVFGAGAGPVEGGDAHLTSTATLAAPRFTGLIAKLNAIRSTTPLPALSGRAQLHYDKVVYRGPSAATGSAWQPAEHQRLYSEQRHQVNARTDIYTTVGQQEAQPLRPGIQLDWQDSARTQRVSATRWQDGTQIKSNILAGHRDMIHLRNRQQTPWQDGIRVKADRQDGWQDRFRRPRPAPDSVWGEAQLRGTDRHSFAGVALPLPLDGKPHWQIARKPPAGRNKGVVPPVLKDPCYVPPNGLDVPLLFRDAWIGDTELIFICDAHRATPATKVVPVRRVYIVINEVQLLRVDGNLELPALALSLSIDMDSWTWKFNASLPASALSNIEPGTSGDPVLLKAIVNGTAYLLLAESIQRDRVFGKSTITVSGRGQSAMLADPYSPILTFANTGARTAQQLIADALTTNGVSLGWDIDWRIDDWTVPSGTWNHQGSYMSAVNTIAASAGAFVQPDPVNKVLRVRPRYPHKPWEWYGTDVIPDIELPSAAVIKESITWYEKPGYNAIYISGSTVGGVLGHIKRAGSAGDIVAPMITDPLITDAIAARQRGLHALADTGRGATYSLSLPVLPETGVIDPGCFIRYVDAGVPIVGVVRSVSVTAGLPSVRQTIEVETHG